MTAPLNLQGIGVSTGIAVAPLLVLRDATAGSRTAGTPAEERAALAAAIETAATELAALIENLDADAAEILEFQSVLLEDDDLLGPVHAEIDAGVPADRAWRTALEREMAAYADGDDPVFAARAGDLGDLRDRVLRALLGGRAESELQEPRILVARDLAPSRFLEIDPGLIAGVALGEGSRTSHVSLLARARGVPLVVGLGPMPDRVPEGAAILDAETGSLVIDPSPEMLAAVAARGEVLAAADARARALAPKPAVTGSGEPVAVMVNVDHPSIIDGLEAGHCDGVGLTRTEFLFQGGAPDEETQLASYRRLVAWADGRPVTIRTLDAGGDKPLPGITIDGESNPFLGVRGLRLSVRRPELFRTQLRALLRAAADGPVKVMVPMVTAPAEMAAVRALVDEVAAGLRAEGLAHAVPPLGMMVEVPAAALAAELFDADFYSIGTNDLVQYATACARDSGSLTDLARGDHPGVIRLIEAVVGAGRARGVEVSVCGDMASNPRDAMRLIETGIRVLSVAPAEIGRIKAAIADHGSGTG